MVVGENASVVDVYRDFSERQARGRSPAYEELTARIAEDPDVTALITTLPAGNKRQPNLLLGAVRYLGGPYEAYGPFRAWLLEHWAAVAGLMLTRFTQTNEPARCATLLPVLSGIPGPLALLEVGASAGLCLYPDRYRYSYDGGPEIGPRAPREGPESPLFDCRTSGGVPVPERVPDVAWRAGIDMNPLDVSDEDDVNWLDSLIWPGPRGDLRAPRLRAAIDVVKDTPPRIVQGDLLDRLPHLAAQVPAGTTLVVFHTAVLMYLSETDRARFADMVRALPGHWLSNEHHSVFPGFGGPLPEDDHLFTLALDGRPVAHTGPHGQSVHRLP